MIGLVILLVLSIDYGARSCKYARSCSIAEETGDVEEKLQTADRTACAE